MSGDKTRCREGACEQPRYRLESYCARHLIEHLRAQIEHERAMKHVARAGLQDTAESENECLRAAVSELAKWGDALAGDGYHSDDCPSREGDRESCDCGTHEHFEGWRRARYEALDRGGRRLDPRPAPRRGDLWRHVVSGSAYRVLYLAVDEPTETPLVVYQNCDKAKHPTVWVRTLERFKERFEPVPCDRSSLGAGLLPKETER